MNKKIYLSPPHLEANEFEYVKEVFNSNWIAPLGPQVDAFEAELCKYVGVDQCAVLSSGTAAIHLALIILGIKQGDEVICSSFTFSASANPITYLHATPVFIDSEKDTWNMDPELLESAIKDRIKKGKKPKALILVHLYGMPAKIDDILYITKKYGVPVIEDAAEALGSNYNNKRLGSFGDIGILSFNGNKIITTSGGGAFISNNKDYVNKAKFLATQARDDAPHYQHSHIGYNYRMSNVLAGIGRGQLEMIEKKVIKRRSNNQFYRSILKDISGIEFLTEPNENFYSNHWLTAITVDPNQLAGTTRESIRLALDNKNIESRPLWKPMHLQPIFKDCPSYSSGVAKKLFEKGLCLPSGSNLQAEEHERIKNVFKDLFKI